MNLRLHPPAERIKKMPITVVLLPFIMLFNTIMVHATPDKPCTGCTLSGSLSITICNSSTYTLAGSCLSATSWTLDCDAASIQSSSSTSATILAVNTDCESVTLTAKNGSTTIATKVIVISAAPTLTGGTISNTSQTINYSTTPSQINASAATGGGCGSLSYQWQSSSDNITFTNISGATSQNYQPGTLTSTTYYRRSVTNSGTTIYTTNTATVTVYPQLVSQTVSITPQMINYNTAPSGLSATSGSGGSGTYTYQWYYSTTGGAPWTSISGATSLSYSPGSLTVTTYYMIQVTSNGATAASNIATITVYPQLVSGSIGPSSQSINYNTVPTTLSVSGTTGGSGSYTYQWKSCATIGGTYSNVSGATSSSYTPPSLTSTTYYEVSTTSNGVTVTSTAATVTVYPQLVSGTITLSTQTINYNTVPSSLSVSAATGGNGTYTYAWMAAPTSGGTYSQVGIGTSYSPSNLTATTYYEVISTSNGANVTSTSAVVIVNPQVFPGNITPSNITLASGTSPGVMTSTPGSGGACGGGFAYQWQSSTDNITYTNITGATNLNFSPGNLTSAIYYRVKVTCGTDVEYSIYSKISIGSIATNLNYIRERTMSKAGVTDTVTADGLTSATDLRQTTTYYDGLGRPIQAVVKQASPQQKDMVTMQVYDALGRESIGYMPYTSPSNDGNFKTNPIGEQNNFNSAQFPGEQYYYGQVAYEPSPLNRPIETYSPGSSWIGGNRGTGSQYQVNTAADSVRIWKIGFTPDTIPTTSGIYPAGELTKNIRTNESNNLVIDYVDLQGRIILKKVQLSSNPGTAHMGWLNTYYVYDDLDNLRFILQPRAVELINGSWAISNTVANELCFRYEYDYRKRLIIKKVPGAGETWIVYDNRDRIVMTQDSMLRSQQKWLFTKYDSENRPDSTGTITDPGNYNNLAYHDGQAAGSISYPNVSTYTNELLTKTFYDDYLWVSGTGTGLSSSMATNYSTNGSYFITSYNTSPTYSVQLVPYAVTRGMLTGIISKVLGTSSQFLYNVNFYDDRDHIIQTQKMNYTGGIDTVTAQVDFSGKPLRIFQNHQKNGLSPNTPQHHNVLTKISYDPTFRIKTIYKNIDGAPSDQLIDSVQYDELGQLRAKYLGNKVDSVIYDYNIRGWINGINKSYVAGTANHYFGLELGYDKAASVSGTTSYLNPIYNGNIEGTVWKSAGDGIGRKYDYTYDRVNRLTLATFVQNSSGSTWDSTKMNFTTSNLNYDANGNILSMNQNGFKVGGSGAIDQLSYAYQTGSNKLILVTDAVNDQNSKLGDFHYNPTTKGSVDYTYDGDGSLITDNNKGIDTLAYNYLKLPQAIHVKGKGHIYYTYDASGNKLKKVTQDDSTGRATTTLYIDGFEYQQTSANAAPGTGIDTLQLMEHEEGDARWAYHTYVNKTSSYGWEYDFFEKDHLGNTRVVLSQEKDTAQYLASMESAYRSTENQLFYNISASCYPRSSVSGYPTDNTTVPNDSVARLNGNGQKVGPAIILKVMYGDTVDIGCKSYYVSQTGTGTNPSVTDVMNSLANGLVNMTSGAKGTLSQLNNTSGPLYAVLSSFMTANNPTTLGQPRAYLNWILLDNQLNYVSSYPQSGAVPVSNFTMGTQGTPGYSGIPITNSGYLYIYVSNETQGWDVFFDNISVRQRSGPMIEEDHFYPFGLTMAGISDKALKMNYFENKKRFNGGSELQNKEFSDGSGLELYDAMHRMYDPQIGRFGQIDPIAPFLEDWSPYVFSFDNPISYSDESGLAADSTKHKPKPHHHQKPNKPVYKSLPAVTVVGHKPAKHDPKSFDILFPGVMPPMAKDKVSSGMVDHSLEINDNVTTLKYGLDDLHTAVDWSEKLTKIGGADQLSGVLGKVGTGLTIINMAVDVKEKRYVDLGINTLSLFPRANPYVFVYTTVKATMYSESNLSGAALDAHQSMVYYMEKSHNARLAGDDAGADEFWEQATKYEKVLNSLIKDLKDKKEGN